MGTVTLTGWQLIVYRRWRKLPWPLSLTDRPFVSRQHHKPGPHSMKKAKKSNVVLIHLLVIRVELGGGIPEPVPF